MYNQLIVYLCNVRYSIEDDYYNNPGTGKTSETFQAELELSEELIKFVLEEKEKNKPKIKLDEDKFWKDAGENLKTSYGNSLAEDMEKENENRTI